MAKILGISGSPRNKSTEYALGEALKSIESRDGIETSMITLRGKKIAPCNGCGYCKKNKTWCCLKDDFEPLLKEFMEADAYLFGSPVYAYGPTPQLSAFFSRMRPLFHVYPELMRDKIGSAFAVGGTRNGGEEATITAMHNMMMARGINIVCNEVYGYAGGYIWSKDQGQEGVDADEIGMGGLLNQANKLAGMALIREYGKKALEEREAAVNERD